MFRHGLLPISGSKGFSRDFQFEDTCLPRRHVHVQSARLQIVAMPVVSVRSQLIFDPPFFAPKIGERKTNVALALIAGIIHDNQKSFARGPLPGKGKETIVGPVAVPAWHALKKLPLTISKDRQPENAEKPS